METDGTSEALEDTFLSPLFLGLLVVVLLLGLVAALLVEVMAAALVKELQSTRRRHMQRTRDITIQSSASNC